MDNNIVIDNKVLYTYRVKYQHYKDGRYVCERCKVMAHNLDEAIEKGTAIYGNRPTCTELMSDNEPLDTERDKRFDLIME